MYKLIIEDDEGKTTVVPLIRDEITIGRKEGNTIRLTERNVSRKHARLMKQNGAVYIEDLTSYNGIRVNGDRINGKAPVNEGDRIQIGDYQLALKLDKAAQPGAPASEQGDSRTMPFVRENAPTQQSDMTATVQTPIASMGTSAQGEAPARLVVVSSNFAGQEFVLDKAAIVIGRTDENDVVVNHRSISRHHAKVVREAGHFHIVDLQSANGVRVNGEEYGKVELRKGDHIDLGHVRLRFVAPGEDFVFDRDAQIVDVGGGGNKALWIGLTAIIAVAVVGVIVWATRPASNGSGGTGGTLASPPPVKPPADVEAQVAKLMLEADKSMKLEDWETAIQRADEALKLDASLDLARDKRGKAAAEKKAQVSYTNFVTFADKSDFDSAVASYGEIADDSMYRQKGAERYATVRRSYVRKHLDEAKAAAKRGDCEEAHQHVEATLTVDESNAEAQEIVKSCKGKAVAVAPTKRDPRPSPTPKPIREPKEIKEPKETKDPEEVKEAPQPSAAIDKMLQDAQDKYVHGQYQSAIDDAKHAAKAQPSKAWRIIGASQCFLKNREGALAAWNKLDAQGRQFLKYVCSRNQITVP